MAEKNIEEKKDVVNEALLQAEDVATDLEHEAEEAAARGFLGGPQMWGWLALAVVIIGLLLLT